MSRRGNCWNNALIKSFFVHINFMEFNTFKEGQETVRNYMIYSDQEGPQWQLKK